MPNAIIFSSTTVSGNVRIANGNLYAVSYTTQNTTGEGGYQVINRGSIRTGDNTGQGTTQPNETGVNPYVFTISVATSGEYWSIN